jgi:predicted transcriptional regulator of viral defense system
MRSQTGKSALKEVLELAGEQHGVVTRKQLLALGMPDYVIKRRVRVGRLHPVRRGVYAVGRPQLGRFGHLTTHVLSCGPGAALSHETAAALWKIRPWPRGPIDVTVPPAARVRPPGIVVHRRAVVSADLTRHHGIPVTTPTRTLVDLGTRLGRNELEAAINEADRLDLIRADVLRSALVKFSGQPGVAALRRVLDERTFVLTDSELERRFLPLTRQAGLPRPQTGRYVSGFKVDFYWPELGLVVETDGFATTVRPRSRRVTGFGIRRT